MRLQHVASALVTQVGQLNASVSLAAANFCLPRVLAQDNNACLELCGTQSCLQSPALTIGRTTDCMILKYSFYRRTWLNLSNTTALDAASTPYNCQGKPDRTAQGNKNLLGWLGKPQECPVAAATTVNTTFSQALGSVGSLTCLTVSVAL